MPDGGQYIWNGGGEMDSGDEEKFFLLSLTHRRMDAGPSSQSSFFIAYI